MIWMLDTDTVRYLINRGPGVDRIKRRLSGWSPGEVRVPGLSVQNWSKP